MATERECMVPSDRKRQPDTINQSKPGGLGTDAHQVGIAQVTERLDPAVGHAAARRPSSVGSRPAASTRHARPNSGSTPRASFGHDPAPDRCARRDQVRASPPAMSPWPPTSTGHRRWRSELGHLDDCASAVITSVPELNISAMLRRAH
ncbi:MAG: hypothetical protein R2710_11065 [Acidimicrobiales bacterium]